MAVGIFCHLAQGTVKSWTSHTTSEVSQPEPAPYLFLLLHLKAYQQNPSESNAIPAITAPATRKHKFQVRIGMPRLYA